MLTDILPPDIRKITYKVYAVALLVLGAIQTGVATAGAPQPSWLVVAFGVLAYVGAAFGFTAAANVPTGRHVALEDVADQQAAANDHNVFPYA